VWLDEGVHRLRVEYFNGPDGGQLMLGIVDDEGVVLRIVPELTLPTAARSCTPR
jgi:hypothetical protein